MSMLFLLVVLAVPIMAPQSGGVTTAPAPVPDTASVEALVKQLGGSDWRAREAATEALMDRGPDVYEPLRLAFQSADSYEVRRRIKSVVQDVYLTQAAGAGPAFLGVRLKNVPDGRIPPRTNVEAISGTVECTGAEKAGLQPDDVLVSINGKTLTQDNFPGGLRTWTKAQKPRTHAQFGVMRGGTALTLTAPVRTVDRDRLEKLNVSVVGHRDDPRVLDEYTALRIGKIDGSIPYSKLREGDLILSVDSEPFSADTAVQEFRRWVRGTPSSRPAQPPDPRFGNPRPEPGKGDGPTLQVLRGGEAFEVEIVLSRVPERTMQPDFRRPEREKAEAGFAMWWQQTFDPEGIAAEGRSGGQDPPWRLVPHNRGR